jgi:hypothetical protein
VTARRASPYPRADRFFLVCFALFILVAFVHEPLFYYYCGWDGLRHNSCTNPTIGAIWNGYARYDPVYFDMPLWMALMIGFDSILLSPFYVYSFWIFRTGRVDTPLYRAIGCTVSGGLIYAMILYLTWEAMSAAQYGTALLPVALYNLPWGIIPLLLVIRLYRGGQTTGEQTRESR